MNDSHDYGDLAALLDYLYERRNFDFRGYEQGSLSRRIIKRMQMVGTGGTGRQTCSTRSARSALTVSSSWTARTGSSVRTCAGR
jgi:hypothetical protein